MLESDTQPQVFHPAFCDEVALTLRCVCRFCSALLVNTDDVNISPAHFYTMRQKLGFFASRRKNKIICHECGASQPTYSVLRTGATSITQSWPPETEFESEEESIAAQEWSAETALLILENISEENLRKLTYNVDIGVHPKNFIVQTVCIAPNRLRPGIKTDDGRGENLLTLAGLSIVKSANKYKKTKSVKDYQAMHVIVSSYLDKSVSTGTTVKSVGSRGAERARGVSQRLKGKRGRFRGNILGKVCCWLYFEYFFNKTILTPFSARRFFSPIRHHRKLARGYYYMHFTTTHCGGVN